MSRSRAAAIGLAAMLAGCGPSRQALDRLASRGEIDQTAPVRAEITMKMAAPVARVWGLLTDIRGWRAWRPDVDAVSIQGAPGPGMAFHWSIGGTGISSRIALWEPDQRLGWTGRAYTLNAVHLFLLTPLPDGTTLVRTTESMDGFGISLFYSSRELVEADTRLLTELRQAAEKR